MESRKLKFALFGNIYQSKKSANITKIMSFLSARGAEICIEKLFHDFLVRQGKVIPGSVGVFDGGDFTADFVISLGGDGTFLRAASYVGDKQIPVIGINIGRLGFLADICPEETESALEALYNGDYTIERHAVISMTVDGKPLDEYSCALNDIALLKRDNASMISIRTSVNGEYLVTYRADGLIVSTPTGSTAYSLSNGGPIIVPQAGILCLTPVAPHSLNIRPIVISDDSEITLTVESRSHNFLVAVDGQSAKCDENAVITIRKAPYEVLIAKRPDRHFFETLRRKMMWGMDTRG